MSDLYPLLFKPVYKDYIWGGDRIIKIFDRDEPPGRYAESWEVSTRSEGMSVVENGPLAGQTLESLVNEFGPAWLGTAAPKDCFPLLIKLIDAKQTLSVQVHPSNDTASAYGGEAKTEMWYVLDADPDAVVYAGLQPGIDSTRFLEALNEKKLEEVLRRVPVRKGDAIYIPGGRVHAVAAGCLLLEVQQNSNTTYRLYDWGRKGADGKPRELHIEQAIRVMVWGDEDDPRVMPRLVEEDDACRIQRVLKTPYFQMDRMEASGPFPVHSSGESFTVLFSPNAGFQCIYGDNRSVNVPRGRSVFIPAAHESVSLVSAQTDLEILRITL